LGLREEPPRPNGELAPAADHSEVSRLRDEELILLLRSGSHPAMSVLFDRFHRLVLSVACRIVRDSAEAEDVMQEVFLEIYRKAALFDPAKGSAKVWILQYAYHRSMNRRQFLALRGHYDPRDGIVPNRQAWDPQTSRNGWGGLTIEERERIMLRGMESLSEKQRTALRLAYFEGLLVKEIAERMGETVERVNNYYFRGLRKLRDVLHEMLTGEKDDKKCAETVKS
jgi:RNA polymerase sigma-70 factor (ECF subfamily)